MAVIKPWAMNALAGAPLYDGPTLRNIFGGLLHTGQSATLPLPGVLDPRALAVDVSSDPTVVVSAGLGVVVTSGGGYVTGLDGAWTGTLAARHATLARIDRVILEVLDTTTQRAAQVRIISGVPAAVPVAPALPSTALSLGTITVPSASGGQAAVSDTRLFSSGAGGIIRVPDNAARLRVSAPATGTVQYVSQADAGALWQRVGTTWSQVYPVPSSDTAWSAASLVNGWQNFGGVFEPLRHRFHQGKVHVQGTIKGGTGGVFTLPPGSRPEAVLPFVGTANAGVSETRVYPTGTVEVSNYYAGGSNAIVGLNFSFFPAAS